MSNLNAAVGYPHTASALTAHVLSAACHRTLTGGGWWLFSTEVAARFIMSAGGVTAAVDTGSFIPANVMYPFLVDATLPNFSFIAQSDVSGNGSLTPMTPSF